LDEKEGKLIFIEQKEKKEIAEKIDGAYMLNPKNAIEF